MRRAAGLAAVIGGAIAVLVTPLQVMVKYDTGWNVIPRPAWEAMARPMVAPLVSFGTPVTMWIVSGSVFAVAMALMFAGVLALRVQARDERDRVRSRALDVLVVAVLLVLLGDAVHTATWHWGGATLPRPGLNPVATAGYSLLSLGMNLLIGATLVLGVAGLRRKFLQTWLGVMLVAVGPLGIFLTVTLFPTTPSGGLLVFSVMMMATGITMARDRNGRGLVAAGTG